MDFSCFKLFIFYAILRNFLLTMTSLLLSYNIPRTNSFDSNEYVYEEEIHKKDQLETWLKVGEERKRVRVEQKDLLKGSTSVLSATLLDSLFCFSISAVSASTISETAGLNSFSACL